MIILHTTQSIQPAKRMAIGLPHMYIPGGISGKVWSEIAYRALYSYII